MTMRTEINDYATQNQIKRRGDSKTPPHLRCCELQTFLFQVATSSIFALLLGVFLCL